MAVAKPDRPIRLNLVEVSERSRQMFELMFARAGKGYGVVVNATVAETTIIDIDGRGGKEQWQKMRAQAPERPLILISLQEQADDSGAILLQKPIRIAELLDALITVREQLDEAGNDVDAAAQQTIDHPAPSPAAAEESSPSLPSAVEAPLETANQVAAGDTRAEQQRDPSALHSNPAPERSRPAVAAIDYSHLVGQRDDICSDDSAALQALQMQTDGYLLEVVKSAAVRAKASGLAITVQLKGGSLLIDPLNNRVVTAALPDQVRTWCEKLLAPGDYKILDVEPGSVDQHLVSGDEAVIETLDSLLWRLALWTYQGRLPWGTLIESRSYLEHWPNLTRLVDIPDAMRIASLWNGCPIPLAHIAEALKIPQRNVFAFYGAAHAIGLAGPAQREADQLAEPFPIQAHEQRTLLSRVVTRLRGLVSG